ncbi:hypothetical protein [Planococcus alpniumensis]|uniref:hypothetical protein n=1 Tax=Planococcus alpniumensis TaxID=2708345 RepID=UPI001B8D5163|nr:hypothetical protein [Planococcus sp. MSAK28401]
MKRIYGFLALLLLTFLGQPLSSVSAMSKLPSPPSGKSIETSETSDSLMDNIYTDMSGLGTPLYGWAIDIFTLLFVVGTLVMILSIAFKNGQWQKYAQGTMLTSFVILLLMRGLPIIMLSMNTREDIDILFAAGVAFLSATTILMAVMSIGISADFKFNYHLIEHPKYNRWSKNLFYVAMLMTFLAVLVPWFFPQV